MPKLLAALLLVLAPQDAAPATAERIDAVVQEFMQTPGAVALSVAVAVGDEMLYERTPGFADLEFDVPADAETMFRIGSITKQFTAAAIVRLAEQGELAIDDPLTQFLPDYPTHGHEITLRHLLTHTAGVPNYTALGPAWYSVAARELPDEELVALWKDRPLDFEPGERWSYSNSGYYLLGMVITKVSGQPYADYLQKEFFEPLHLTRTRYDSNGEVLRNRAQGYGWEDERFWNDRLIGMSQPGAAGGLISTAGDLVRWQRALVTGKVVRPESYEEMTLPYLLNGGGETTYGLGLSLEDRGGRRCISHGGGIFGFNSFLAWFPDEGLSVAVISNSEGLSSEALVPRLVEAALAGH
jgi:D-alanyl-D-alanine carboxypeptidase